ncbi:hypothetical protein H0O01_03655 [Candidatus Micrarchaeota archaeon]|nr:hypothetical protein [Candidatus Micrarchaeota archaeon]
MECRKIGTDCGKSFLAEPRAPARRIFATALLVGGALFASCKSEPATPAHANVTLPVVAPAQVGGEQNSAPGGSQYLGNPYLGGSEADNRAAGTGRGATRPGKERRGTKDLNSGGGVVRNPFGGEEQQGSTSEETQDAGAEPEAAADASQGIVRNPFGGEETQDAGAEQDAAPDASQGGRGGAGNPYGEEVVRPVFGGEEEPMDAGAEDNRGGSDPYNQNSDAGSSGAAEGRVVTNPHASGTQQDSGGIVRNPMEK